MRTQASRGWYRTGTILCWLAAVVSGCSTFNRDWKAAEGPPSAADPLSGRWQGIWRSDVNGHEGKLRCLLTREQEGKYLARFHATYASILRFQHSALLAVEEAAGIYRFKGEADLGGLAGGVYQYQGFATLTNFFSTYRCVRDHGTFQMVRPQ